MNLLEHLADSFPQFDAIAEVYKDALPPRMRGYLENIYTTLLDFFRIVAEIFTASNGSE